MGVSIIPNGVVRSGSNYHPCTGTNQVPFIHPFIQQTRPEPQCTQSSVWGNKGRDDMACLVGAPKVSQQGEGPCGASGVAQDAGGPRPHLGEDVGPGRVQPLLLRSQGFARCLLSGSAPAFLDSVLPTGACWLQRSQPPPSAGPLLTPLLPAGLTL